MSRNVSLGVKYPPLPKWMEKLPRAQGADSMARSGTGVYNTDGTRSIKASAGVEKASWVEKSSWVKRVGSLSRIRADGSVVRAGSGHGDAGRGLLVRRRTLPRWVERLPKRLVDGAGGVCARKIEDTGSRNQSTMPKWMERLPGNKIMLKGLEL
jgi:hypothetical protein